MNSWVTQWATKIRSRKCSFPSTTTNSNAGKRGLCFSYGNFKGNSKVAKFFFISEMPWSQRRKREKVDELSVYLTAQIPQSFEKQGIIAQIEHIIDFLVLTKGIWEYKGKLRASEEMKKNSGIFEFFPFLNAYCSENLSWELQKLALQTGGAASFGGLQGLMGLVNGIPEIPTKVVCLNQVCFLPFFFIWYIYDTMFSLCFHNLLLEGDREIRS